MAGSTQQVESGVVGDWTKTGRTPESWTASVPKSETPKSEADAVVDFMTRKVNGLGIPGQTVIDAITSLIDTLPREENSRPLILSLYLAKDSMFKLAAKDTRLARVHGEAMETNRSILSDFPQVLALTKDYFGKKYAGSSAHANFCGANIQTALTEIEQAYAETIGKSRGAVASVA